MTEDPDRFLVAGEGEPREVKIKGSRFLGQVFPVSDEESAEARLSAIRRRFHDATHHCWATRLGVPESVRERFDDDGEPSGTAGAPLLRCLQGAGLVDALVVVIRYYGGTKLGTGGLVRAYTDAAQEALGATPRITSWRETRLSVQFDYADLGAIENVLRSLDSAILAVDRRYEEESPRVQLRVKRSRAEAVHRQLTELTAGRARILREEL